MTFSKYTKKELKETTKYVLVGVPVNDNTPKLHFKVGEYVEWKDADAAAKAANRINCNFLFNPIHREDFERSVNQIGWSIVQNNTKK